jgi:5'-nucleotidase
MRTAVIRSLVATVVFIASPQVFALNVLLTNDDGWNAAGIQSMKAALVADGHDVVLVGSSTQQSGSSAAINTDDVEVVKQREPSDDGAFEYSVGILGTDDGAEPATSVLVGIGIAETVFGGAPDLVISGINAGQNLGGFTQISGTVGAATVAISKALGGGTLPAIAISTDELCDPVAEAGCDAVNGPIYDAAANFVVDLVAALDAKHGALMPSGVGLNINYPPLQPVAGAVVARQGQTGKFPGVPGAVSLTFGCYADCVSADVGVGIPGGITGVVPVEETVAAADTIKNEDGFVTVVPIRSDFTTGFVNKDAIKDIKFRAKLKRILRKMGY